MKELCPPQPEVYVGALIEYESERVVFQSLLSSLPGQSAWAVIFANVTISGRQIDFVVATEKLTLIVEAKSYGRPVRGTVNGDWETLSTNGVWKKIGNAYLQALGEKNALRDQMQGSNAVTGYPDACVVVVPNLRTGSDLTEGDFKVAVGTLDELPVSLKKTSSLCWTLADWRQLASQLGLQKIATPKAAYSISLFQAENFLSTYHSAFKRMYGPVASSLQDDTYRLNDETTDARGVVRQVFDCDDDVLVSGPSGCGKSLLACYVAVESLGAGFVPVFLQAQHFDGRLAHSLDMEVSLLTTASARTLVGAAKILGQPLLLVIDGYNECPASVQLSLTRSMAAASIRYGARVVTTSQNPVQRPDLLGLTTIRVQPPNKQLREKLAGIDSTDPKNRTLCLILESISTGLEATLVGRVGKEMPSGRSKFSLFDAYARQRLQVHASEGIEMLSQFAGLLIDRLSYGLSIREFDRLASAAGTSAPGRRAIEASQLLSFRGERVSFSHELFFTAFAAEAVVRQAGGQASSILSALATPRYHDCTVLILGAIDDSDLTEEVLGNVCDEQLLKACAQGQCGATAKRWVEHRCQEVLEHLRDEANALIFEVSDSSWMNIGVSEGQLNPSHSRDAPFISVIAENLDQLAFMEPVLVIIGLMDANLDRHQSTLREAARERKIALRSGLFANAYVHSRDVLLAKLVSYVHSGGVTFRRNAPPGFSAFLLEAWRTCRSSGQVYLLLAFTKWLDDPSFAIPYVLPRFTDWRFQPYHLQLDLVDFAQYLGETPEPVRSELIAALESLFQYNNPIFNGLAYEALESLGALEQDERAHMEGVRAELQQLLVAVPDESVGQRAWAIYGCQFDHPFSSAYYEAVDELSPEQQNIFLSLACTGPSNDSTFFLGPLIRRLADFNDPMAGKPIEKWTHLPSKRNALPQDAIEVFVTAHAALGTLGLPLPADRGLPYPPAHAALLACGELQYWVNRKDLSQAETAAQVAPAFRVLMDHDLAVSAAALTLVEDHMRGYEALTQSLVSRFPDEALEICRAALVRRDKQIGYFDHHFRTDVDEVAAFSLSVIEKFGDQGDLPYLRKLSDLPNIGVAAVRAIRKIEGRSVG